jgi:hypothetical protein
MSVCCGSLAGITVGANAVLTQSALLDKFDDR